MRTRSVLFVLTIATLPACGSGQGSEAPPSTAPGAVVWNPPALEDGYTRIVSPTVHDVKPGGDVTYCQYVMAPFDHDVDVLSVKGAQSKFGHHAVAFAYSPGAGEEIGSNTPCMGTEFTAGDGTSAPASGGLGIGGFLGAVGGADSKRSSFLPEGVAFRLTKGQGVLLNVHYLNTGSETIDGDAVVDLKFADIDPSRLIASLFINLNGGFELPASSPATSSVDCVAKSDVKIIWMSNHMHEYGTTASTQVTRVDTGAVEELHDDATWTYDMQFNPSFTTWPSDDPFVLHAGDTLRTTCNWNNTTSSSMKFPREMCVGTGFALTTGDHPTAPMCLDGAWLGN
jgi:hypothetical protein